MNLCESLNSTAKEANLKREEQNAPILKEALDKFIDDLVPKCKSAAEMGHYEIKIDLRSTKIDLKGMSEFEAIDALIKVFHGDSRVAGIQIVYDICRQFATTVCWRKQEANS